jgi:hypothetical protein
LRGLKTLKIFPEATVGKVVGRSNISELPISKPCDYHIPASDKEGESAVLRVRINRKYLATVRLLVQQHRDVHGWVFDSDFFRWAVHRGLEEMAHRVKSGSLSANVAALKLAASAAQVKQEHQNFMTAVDSIMETVEWLYSQGDYGEAKNQLIELQQRIKDDPNPFWRKKWGKMIRARFGHILKEGLDQIEEDGDGGE